MRRRYQNIIGANASLYNKTYEKIVDDNNTLNPDPTKNFIEVSHVNGNFFSDLTVNCFLDTSEPSGQNAFDNTTTSEGTYVFDEIGLVNYDGKLLTHAIFSPVEKSLNRRIQIYYNIRIQLI